MSADEFFIHPKTYSYQKFIHKKQAGILYLYKNNDIEIIQNTKNTEDEKQLANCKDIYYNETSRYISQKWYF